MGFFGKLGRAVGAVVTLPVDVVRDAADSLEPGPEPLGSHTERGVKDVFENLGDAADDLFSAFDD